MEEQLVQKSKDKFYRGKNTKDIKTFDTREFAKLIKSRARRTILRNYNIIEKFVKKCEIKASKNRPIKTHSRSLIIVPKMLGKVIHVHNGKEFIKVEIIEEMLGHRLGEFALTRKQVKHSKAGIGATKSSSTKAK